MELWYIKSLAGSEGTREVGVRMIGGTTYGGEALQSTCLAGEEAKQY